MESQQRVESAGLCLFFIAVLHILHPGIQKMTFMLNYLDKQAIDLDYSNAFSFASNNDIHDKLYILSLTHMVNTPENRTKFLKEYQN